MVVVLIMIKNLEDKHIHFGIFHICEKLEQFTNPI